MTPQQFTPKQLSSQEFAQYEQNFWDFAQNAAGRDELYPVLLNSFSDSSLQEEQAYYYDFFRWFSYINWKQFLTLGKAEVVRAFERQVMHAFAFGLDPLQLLMNYMLMKCYTHTEAAELFARCKEAFLHSDSYVNTYKEKVYTVKDLVSLLGFSGKGKNSVERAKGYTEALEIIEVPEKYAGKMKYYPREQPRELIDLFSELASFFVTTEKEDISPLLIHFEFDNLFEEYPNSDQQQRSNSSEQSMQRKVQPIGSQIAEDSSPTFLQSLKKNVDGFEEWISQTSSLSELLVWMNTFSDKSEARNTLLKQLQQLFPKIGNDFAKASAVIEMDHFLQANGYASNEDMLYYDENTQQFTWNL